MKKIASEIYNSKPSIALFVINFLCWTPAIITYYPQEDNYVDWKLWLVLALFGFLFCGIYAMIDHNRENNIKISSNQDDIILEIEKLKKEIEILKNGKA